jgi:hypothetical protein
MAVEHPDAKKHASKLPRVADFYEGELVEKAFAVLDAAHADGGPAIVSGLVMRLVAAIERRYGEQASLELIGYLLTDGAL